MINYSCHYYSVPKGISSLRTYKVDASTFVKLNNGKYAGCSVVYSKNVPKEEVLKLVELISTIPTAPVEWESFGNNYVLTKDGLMCIHETGNTQYIDTDIVRDKCND